MSGKKGQLQIKARKDTARQRIWQSMRIMRRFTIADLMRTTGSKHDNTRKYVVSLAVHGYVRENTAAGYIRGVKGAFKVWSITLNPGPDHPLVCAKCGQQITAPVCKPPEESI